MIVLEVVIPVPLSKNFHYLPPDGVNPENIVGKRVRVQFGRRTLIAYAVSCQSIGEDSPLKLKRIIGIVDRDSLITKEAMDLADYISKNYICSLGEAFASIIPVSMKLSRRTIKVKNRNYEITQKRHALTSQQESATNLINENLERNIYTSFLLYGITASGKTEVYINAIEHALKQNKSAIMLIPEISLTPQFVCIIIDRFGPSVGVWHSSISNISKYELFLKAKNGVINIMLGTRSAIFTPFKNLGLIIVDEEHEYTYKQDQKPSYDAREIAKWRGKYHNAVVVLGSATPSFETYKDSIEKKINLLRLSERIDRKELPEIKVISLKNRIFKTSLLLPETIEAISRTLAKKEQIIIFLNRRGYSPSIICRKCASVYQCSKCSISMVFHRNPDLLKCHYCGETKCLPMMCSVCGSKDIMVFGTGTQKIEEELKKLFKNVKIFRLDADTAYSKKIYERAYSCIKNEEYDILLGTQMIAKGFDFPRIGLVCVLNADTSLYLPGFKSVERTFQLITQVAGRSGRGNMRGTVIVQTNHPQHYAIKYAKNYDFLSFYNAEMEQRRKLLYPPYCDIAKVSIKNKDEKRADKDSEKLLFFLEELIDVYELRLKLLGPVSAYIAKLNNVYRRYIIIKGDRKNIIKLARFLEGFNRSSGTFVEIEIMPSDLI
jgi:primosomal protein N' (replication factor Y)